MLCIMDTPVNYVEIKGDLLESKAQYIVHQTNCKTWKARGLSFTLFRKFPWANVYSRRAYSKKLDEPGTIMVKGDGVKKRYVINLMGQKFPGRPNLNSDSVSLRKHWFQLGLSEISKLKPESLAFPKNIGCGLAKGSWDDYRGMLVRYAKEHPETQVNVLEL